MYEYFCDVSPKVRAGFEGVKLEKCRVGEKVSLVERAKEKKPTERNREREKRKKRRDQSALDISNHHYCILQMFSGTAVHLARLPTSNTSF